jgi:glucose-6-phosphate 1-dehydrogenase
MGESYVNEMTFVLFGATGDLAKRKIYPALYNLFLDQKMPESFSVVGLGRRKLSHDEFQANVKQSLSQFSRRLIDDNNQVEAFLDAFRYHSLDVNNAQGYKQLLEFIQQRENELNIAENRLFYLSVAPQFFEVIASNIKESGLGAAKGWKRLIIEKPFGHDVISAYDLNEKLSQAFAEEEIYRIDHYLGKPMIRNLETLLAANPQLQALWSNEYIANVQITASETVGVEERAGYYDQAGAIRDMFQNHMLQMLMMTAIHLPTESSAQDVRDEKINVIHSVRPLQRKDVSSQVVRGQYDAGEIQGKSVVQYTEEPGIDDASTNDTFVAARLWIDNEQWSGVPFYIRTGKRMSEKSTKIVIEFKKKGIDLSADQEEETVPNLLVIEVNPNEGVFFHLNSENLLNAEEMEPIHTNITADEKNVPEAYELLIFDALRGDSTFFVHWDEVRLSWQWVQPILEAFEEQSSPLYKYPAGSMGPEASHQLLEEDEFGWWEGTKTLTKRRKKIPSLSL